MVLDIEHASPARLRPDCVPVGEVVAAPSSRGVVNFHVEKQRVTSSKSRRGRFPHARDRGLQFSYGVTAVHEANEPEDWTDYIRQRLPDGLRGLILLTAGPSSKHPEANYRLEIIDS